MFLSKITRILAVLDHDELNIFRFWLNKTRKIEKIEITTAIFHNFMTIYKRFYRESNEQIMKIFTLK